MLSDLLTSAKDYLLELLFPIKCVVCGKETGNPLSLKLQRPRKNKLICTDCLKTLNPSLNLYCPLCEAKSIDGGLCVSCFLLNPQAKPPLDRLFYPFSYKEIPIQKIIKAFKYHFIKELEIPLGRLMINYLEKIKEKVDFNNLVVIPVPLHRRKFNQRGYNQSELIADKIAAYLNTEIINDYLLKTKSTKDQISLKENQRLENLKNVFVCRKPEIILGKKILLVDDVYTTGATMTECAKVLKEAGAKEVVSLVIARG